MATTFKKSVPYNTIRLAGDVAQWASIEETYADSTGFASTLNPAVVNVSMADMQRASGTNIDPGDGRVQIGLLSPQRYGISVQGDVSAGDGVYGYQVDKTIDSFVGTRNYNLAGNPVNIRLGRLAQWDYTANLEEPDMDKFDIETGGSTAWYATSFLGSNIFRDQPLWVWGGKDDSNNRYVYVVRSNPNGDRYSSYKSTNYLRLANTSDMNDVGAIAPVQGFYGTPFNTSDLSFITFGRRTSLTSDVKAGTYVLTIAATGSLAGSTSGAGNLSAGIGTSIIPQEAAYVDDDLIALVVGKNNGTRSLLRVTNTSTTPTATSTALTATNSDVTGCSVVSTRSDYGSTLRYAFPAWTENDGGTANRYIKMACYNLHSGISQVGSDFTVFDSANTFKGVRVALLNSTGSTSQESTFLVAASDTSGDLRFQVVGFSTGTFSITGFPSTTYQYNDTSIQDRFAIVPLSAVEKTAISTSGENFVPGGTNDFEKRRYFAVNISTAVETDTMRFLYGYYDITNKTLVIWDGGSFTGRNTALAKNHFDTDDRTYISANFNRGNAGPIFMPWLGGRYITSTNKRLSFGMTALDYKPYWGNINTADPGGTNIYDATNLLTTDATSRDFTTTADWGQEGIWNVNGPAPFHEESRNSALLWSTSGSGVVYSNGVGASLEKFALDFEDVKLTDWRDFVDTELIPYNLNNSVYIKVATGALSATYTLPAGQKQVGKNATGFTIDWRGSSNSHAGDQWGWAYNTAGGTNNRVSIGFKQSPW